MVKTLLSAEYLCTIQRSIDIYIYAAREMMMSKSQSKKWLENQSFVSLEAFCIIGSNFAIFVFTAKWYIGNVQIRAFQSDLEIETKRGKRVVS